MKRGIKKKKRRREKFTNRKRKKEREKKEGKKKENNGYDKVGYDFRPSVRYRWINNKPEWQWQFRGIQKLEPCLPRTVGRLISLSRHVNARRLQPRKGPAAFFPYTRFLYRVGKGPPISLRSWTRSQTRLVIQFLEERSHNGIPNVFD